MISAELLGLPDLAKTQALSIHKTIKVGMIDKNKEFVFATF